MANEVTASQQEMSTSERFANKVLSEFGKNNTGELRITDYQRTLIQGYFVAIDRALTNAEIRRLNSNKNNSDHKYDNNLPIVWANINLEALAQDVVHYARIGLDMMQKNHLYAIPYKNNTTNKYDVNLMEGYVGIQYIAEKYALEKPVNVVTELVYSTDKFTVLKKGKDRAYDSYEFEVTNAFNRGEIIGGFGYIEYADKIKNKLVIMSITDILKRKPEKASAEFWGGKASRWQNGKKQEVELDGWYEEMCLKTLKRFVFNETNIPRDPQKIDDDYLFAKNRQTEMRQSAIQHEIDENANQIPLDIDMETGEILDADYKELGDEMSEEEIAQAVREAEMAAEAGIDF